MIKVSSVSALTAALKPLLSKADPAHAKMPVAFIGHGSPLNGIQQNDFTRNWATAAQHMPKPSAILAISAHWLSRGATYLSGNTHPKTIYDFYGFPDELYKIEYPAPGSPSLAESTVETLANQVPNPSVNMEWGLDHGTWTVLHKMYPAADIPVVQLSLDYDMSLPDHLEMGKTLSILRNQGVLILGSGNLVHNLRALTNETTYDWAVEFSSRVSDWITDRDFEAATSALSLGQISALAHPTHEHYLPLLPVLGAIDSSDQLVLFNQAIVRGAIDMQSLIALPSG